MLHPLLAIETSALNDMQMSQNGRSFRPLQRLRARRAFFDSGEWASSKQQHAATGEPLQDRCGCDSQISCNCISHMMHVNSNLWTRTAC